MADTVRDVMNPDPVAVHTTASVEQAAKQMKTYGIGDVLVADDTQIRGILTDRDIVVRTVAEGKAPATTPAGECCTGDVQVVEANDSTAQAAALMRRHAVRRLPVVDGDRLVGMVSLGDLAVARDDGAVLADISAAGPQA